jgi:hypothetical protein
MEQRYSDKLALVLKELETEISKFVRVNDFYLDFEDKSWAACTAGQALLAMTTLAINLKYDIETLRRFGL